MDIAGDIGGTHTRLALFDPGVAGPAAVEVYRSGEHGGLEAMISAFLAAHPATIERACFGVAGPVQNGHAKTTNLAWPVDAPSVAQVLGIEHVGLVNDLYANAYGIADLGPDDIETLREGDPTMGGNAAVISAGTGLGEAGLFWDRHRYHVFASEGGHTDFGPRDEDELALRAYLARNHAHVSYERVCSGMGLVAIHDFLAHRAGRGGGRTDASAITKAALDGSDDICSQALDMMVRIYGAEAGNLALKLLATGGIYVGGGIAPRILPRLQDGSFLEALDAKGRFAGLLSRIPVHVILNDRTALLGAARLARGDEPGLHRR
jgi:glucokinase